MSIISPSGYFYKTNGFQSLSSKQSLQLRAGASSKQLHSSYVAPQWSPALDILAVPEGKALRLVRLSGGETIWRRTVDENQQSKVAISGSFSKQNTKNAAGDAGAICAIAWNPAGTCVAVLHTDGILVQREATHGDIVYESSLELEENERVASMEWIGCESNVTSDSSLANSALSSALLEFSLPVLSPLNKSKATPSNINPEQEHLTAVIITTENGAVWVMLDGIFALPVAKLPLPQISSTGEFFEFKVLNSRISNDASKLFIYLANSSTAVCTLNTSILSTVSPLLRSLVYLSARLSGLCLYIENATDLAVNEAEARGDGASRAELMRVFEGILRDHGVDEATSPDAELSRLVVTGRASEPTSQFLLAKLKTAKLMNWERSGRQGALAIVRLVYQYIGPAIEGAILAAGRLLHTIAEDFSQLAFAGNKISDSSALHSEMNATKDCIMRTIIILGWMYGRFKEYATRLQNEQRENQEFIDWALFALDDLNWQNEGIRRTGNDGVDDGLRPMRPEIDYKLLLKFIRSAFRRRPDDEMDEQAETQCILNLPKGRASSEETIVKTYFDVLVEKSNMDSIKLHWANEGDFKQDNELFGLAFHSSQLLDEAVERSNGLLSYASESLSSREFLPPTCREALFLVKSFIARALAWPSVVLGQSLQWDTLPSFSYNSNAMPMGSIDSNNVVGRICDMRCIGITANSSLHDYDGEAGTMYIATTSASSRVLELLVIPNSGHSEGTAHVAHISLTVKVQLADMRRSEIQRLPLTPAGDASEETREIAVSGLSFFDDDTLGMTFAISGCESTYLGSIKYRLGDSTIVYTPICQQLQNSDNQVMYLLFNIAQYWDN
ncbi:hypothetical protein GGI25_003591 [Coemansia spiralis]|uniref:Anaphase-promoting complex subunit 4 n=1 Tax=Coemansia spiralis TaxID=417178 RepID=A0A9W8G7V0_9FUNG|nr:hypothetical protein GGI26_004250 [Coemansia sp. RSA 1358]KAJ2676441.1 hypothetical protein GGI25_003591 [Coemansia spiralis]